AAEASAAESGIRHVFSSRIPPCSFFSLYHPDKNTVKQAAAKRKKNPRKTVENPFSRTFSS
ncbi:MAG: hypothetical protein IIY43_10185, partial [Oscillospiraceae bacterium]|nr:hypothetical protein [Oscillospiraceae bacterium]